MSTIRQANYGVSFEKNIISALISIGGPWPVFYCGSFCSISIVAKVAAPWSEKKSHVFMNIETSHVFMNIETNKK